MPISVTNLIRKVFGYSAGGGFIQDPIPDTTVTPGRASFEQGFPPLTMTQKVAGGIPPFGQDMNGILAMITNNLAGLNAGQINVYDSTFATDIGGYAKGAMLGMADGTGWWINLTANNTTDPDANGAGWAPMYRYDWTTISGLVGGTRTLTQMEARSRVILLQGVLGSNQTVEFPTQLREWLIINSTTGAFTLTCKTAAGTGVVVPNGGGSNATQIYCDGTNIYYSAAPTSISVSQAGDPLSVAQRTAAGALVASSFNDLTAMVNTFGPRNLASSGYYTLPGNLKIQWGRNTLSGNTTGIINYPSPYSSWSRVAVGAYRNSVSDQDNVYAGNGTATGFSYANGDGNSASLDWIAIGV